MVYDNYIQRIITLPEMSVFLFGPRGTGKSTWLHHTYPDSVFIDLLDEGLYQSYLVDIEQFADELRALAPGDLIVIDEVQRLPALLNEVHRHIENRGLRFILSGSSARKLRRGGVNLLAGRAAWRTMHPFVPEELDSRFSIEETLRWGSLPIVTEAFDKKATLEAYVQMYLKEEIQAEALVRNLPGFARFLSVAALFHGQAINVASLARDAGVARTTVAGYLDILEDTLLAFRLPAFESRMRVRERKHPKLYWIDPGLPRALMKRYGPLSRQETGHLFEGWVAGVLRAYRDYRELFDDWFFWAPSKPSRVEVDFVLRKGDDFVAIEVKSAANLSKADLKGLRAIGELEGVRRRLVVYLGLKKRTTPDGIQILPLQSFLEQIEADRLF